MYAKNPLPRNAQTYECADAYNVSVKIAKAFEFDKIKVSKRNLQQKWRNKNEAIWKLQQGRALQGVGGGLDNLLVGD